MATLYPVLVQVHHWAGWAALISGLVLGAVALYIGVIRHRDATPHFRRGVYAVFGLVLVQGALGALLYALGGRPFEEVHLIYGIGALLALPFFMYIERTAEKRPAMSSYIWGGFLLAGIALRAIMTGAAG
jgi:heme A synthase